MRRRTFLRAGSAATLAGLLAGCASPSESGSDGTETFSRGLFDRDDLASVITG
jgi:hypothetical protein